jgi:hypothetical protein
VDLSAASSRARHPSVSIAPSGAVHVTWDTDDGQVFVDRFTTRWEPAVRLTDDGGNTYPSVTAAGGGADVIWTHTAQGRSSVRYLGRGAEGSTAAPLVSPRTLAGGALVILLALATLARLRSRRLRARAA